jgi:hypothetical protein
VDRPQGRDLIIDTKVAKIANPTADQAEPAPAPAGPSGGTIFGAAVCVAAGILIAKAVFSK